MCAGGDWIGVDFLIRRQNSPRDKSKIQEYKQNVQERVRSLSWEEVRWMNKVENWNSRKPWNTRLRNETSFSRTVVLS